MQTSRGVPIFELHISPKLGTPEQVAMFIGTCKIAGIKAFLVDNGMGKVSTHLMTSAVCRGGRALSEAKWAIQAIAEKVGLPIARNKVEVPMSQGFDYVTGSDYYEVHVELDLKGKCIEDVPFDNQLWSYSHRPDKNQGMLTMRARNTTAPIFRLKAKESMAEFDDFIKPAGVQFEKCIADDNSQMDADWMIGY